MDPDPFTVATWTVKSLTMQAPPDGAASRTASAVRVSVTSFSFVGEWPSSGEANCSSGDFSLGKMTRHVAHLLGGARRLPRDDSGRVSGPDRGGVLVGRAVNRRYHPLLGKIHRARRRHRPAR